jgi:hypothetical protein
VFLSQKTSARSLVLHFRAREPCCIDYAGPTGFKAFGRRARVQ